jgi:hypothetical protein
MTTINWLKLFRKIISVYSENMKLTQATSCGQNSDLMNVKAVVSTIADALQNVNQ